MKRLNILPQDRQPNEIGRLIGYAPLMKSYPTNIFP